MVKSGQNPNYLTNTPCSQIISLTTKQTFHSIEKNNIIILTT